MAWTKEASKIPFYTPFSTPFKYLEKNRKLLKFRSYIGPSCDSTCPSNYGLTKSITNLLHDPVDAVTLAVLENKHLRFSVDI